MCFHYVTDDFKFTVNSDTTGATLPPYVTNSHEERLLNGCYVVLHGQNIFFSFD